MSITDRRMNATARYALMGQLAGIAATIALSGITAALAFTLIPDATAAVLAWFIPSLASAVALPALGLWLGGFIGLRREFGGGR